MARIGNCRGPITQRLAMINFLLFGVFGLAALVLGAYCEEPIKNAIEFVIDWAKARFAKK